MAYIEGHARDQALLLLTSVEDYVSADNPVCARINFRHITVRSSNG
jgi:hypothetical protein